jgi:hypothetical protein
VGVFQARSLRGKLQKQLPLCGFATAKRQLLKYALPSLIFHLFILPQSGIVPGRQNTVMRRHCAPAGEAQPPHDGILPACR